MCGRYALYGPRSRSRADNRYLDELDVFPDRYNVAPTQLVPIARLVDGDVRVTAARWGLIPFWAKDPKIGQRMINAVSEEVTEKKSYAPLYRKKRRCIVPACGFYEWEPRPKGTPRQPYYFTSPDDRELLAFAGLWDTWKQPDGDTLVSYTVMTVAPNDFMARFHDRMPVVLEPDDYDEWLNADDPRSLLKAFHNEALINYPVTARVNAAAIKVDGVWIPNEDPSFVEPITL